MGANVTSRQKRAIEALVTTGVVTDAAASARVARRTIYRWLRQDAFRDALHEAEGEALAEVSRRLVALGNDAVDTVGETMRDSSVSATVRVRAADIVFGRMVRMRELIELEDRLQALEDKIGGGTWRR